MSESESDLEIELRELQPAVPSARLAAGIEQELHHGAATSPHGRWPRTVRWSLWTSWSLTTAAAAAALVAWWPAMSGSRLDAAVANTPEKVVTRNDPMVPVSTSNVLTDAQDEGFVVLDDGRPARQMRLHYVETVRLRDADARADIAVSRPREEVRFVPVSLY